jgi:Domain of unknown function (DUF5668)
METGAPAAGFVAPAVPPVPTPPMPPGAPMPSSSGPNPTVAGILAGVFPFGVGAVYTGQYAKGLAHLAILGLLIAGCNVSGSDLLPVVCGIGIAFFYVYQIIDAVRSAKAMQAGLPAPDPYGLAANFGGGTKVDSSRVPMGAIVLILLGAIFLLHTAGMFEFGLDRFWPVLLIVLGAWLLARNYGLLDTNGETDPRACRRRLMGPAMLITIGTLFLLESLRLAGFHRTWPVILLVVGGVKLLQGAGSGLGSGGNYPGSGSSGGDFPPPPPVPPPPVPPSSGEVKNG